MMALASRARSGQYALMARARTFDHGVGEPIGKIWIVLAILAPLILVAIIVYVFLAYTSFGT